ncbi:hypothetical protein [Sulfuracidifex tepidarius]|uniref:hypothetical protein n=1 Tax=Sulfuracidifex tepidarius TaxID=1294262 RepID=UPI0011F1C7A2|nr:hypothetical protein [Sulfuracidifex tepidarius]
MLIVSLLRELPRPHGRGFIAVPCPKRVDGGAPQALRMALIPIYPAPVLLVPTKGLRIGLRRTS